MNFEAPKVEQETSVRFINEQRITRLRDNACGGWDQMCGGHKTFDDAVKCKEKHIQHSTEESKNNPEYKKAWDDFKIELRIMKVTLITEVAEDIEEVKL